MQQIFDLLTAACQTDENRWLLRAERFWYGDALTISAFSDDVKRETRALVLASTQAELRNIVTAMAAHPDSIDVRENAVRITLSPAARQPGEILFVENGQRWSTEALRLEPGIISLTDEAKMLDVLLAAGIAARYPQYDLPEIPVTFKPDTTTGLVPSQTFRRLIFKRIILGRKPSQGLRLLDRFGMLDAYLPEVTAGRHLTQNRFHAHDIFEHLLHSVDGAYDLNEPVRWSALLHDIGKVPTRQEGENGEASFHNHELYSARMIVPIMKRLAVPITIGQKVKFLVRNHMFHYTDEWSDKAVRRFVKKVPLEELQDLISLRMADRKGSGKKSAFPKALQKLIGHIDEIIAQEKEFKVKDLAIDGHALMKMGMPASREMGDMLKFLFDEVKSGRTENSAQVLESIVRAKLAATPLLKP
jgi:hypothetical protein